MTTEEKINQLSMLEQSIQKISMQKQQFQAQLTEIDSALSEISNKEKAYKIVGNIMVLKPKVDIEKDLNSKKEIAELRIKTLEKQEEKAKEKAKALQEEVMKSLGEQNGSENSGSD